MFTEFNFGIGNMIEVKVNRDHILRGVFTGVLRYAGKEFLKITDQEYYDVNNVKKIAATREWNILINDIGSHVEYARNLEITTT